MATVSPSTLTWLRTVLINGYHYRDEAYQQIELTLSQFPYLQPRTDVLTSRDGRSSLCVLLSGQQPSIASTHTRPSTLSIWLSHSFPASPPIVYLDSARGLRDCTITADGSVQHPYLATWERQPRSHSLLELVRLIGTSQALEGSGSRATTTASNGAVVGNHQPNPQFDGPRVPFLPPVRPAGLRADGLPPVPGKTPFNQPVADVSPPRNKNTGPPAPPPKPFRPAPSAATTGSPGLEQARQNTRFDYQNEFPVASTLPTIPDARYRNNYSQDPSYARTSPRVYHLPPQAQSYGRPDHPALNGNMPNPQFRPANLGGTSGQITPQLPWQGAPPNQRSSVMPQSTGHQSVPAWAVWQHPVRVLQQPQRPDLLSEPSPAEGITGISPAPSTAPPVPLNPEKDELIHRIVEAVARFRTESSTQLRSSLSALGSQRDALSAASERMSQEAEALQLLDAQLSTNERIIKETMTAVDGIQKEARRSEVPPADEVLIAPHVIGNQLYDLVSQERAMHDVLFALTRALDAGRIGLDVWAKHTRATAREQFFKKALVTKIAEETGLLHPVGSAGSSNG